MKTYMTITYFLISLGFSIEVFAVDPYTPLIFARQLQQMQQEAKETLARYNQLKDQLDKTRQLIKDAEGHYGYGSLKNGSGDLKDREWSPDNWQDTLKGLSGGNPQRYQQLLDEYKQNNPTLSDKDYKNGASDAKDRVYKQEIEVNRASQVQASYAFNDIKQHLETVHTLSEKIEQAQNTKAALDLNSRLVAELAYISIQELKMQTVLNQQLSQQQAGAIAAETESAKFNTLPEE